MTQQNQPPGGWGGGGGGGGGGDGGWGGSPPQAPPQQWGQPTAQPGYGQPGQPSPGWGQPQPGAPLANVAAPYASAKAAGYQPSEDEKTHAFYAHLFAAVANLLFCGAAVPIVAPFFVTLMTKERTPFLMYHVNQSLVFQAVLFAVNIPLLIIGILTCGIGLVLCVIPPLIGIIYPFVVGSGARNGEWSEYPVVGAKVLSATKPLIK